MAEELFKIGSRTSEWLWWLDWHDRCVPARMWTGAISHLFRTFAAPQILHQHLACTLFTMIYQVRQN